MTRSAALLAGGEAYPFARLARLAARRATRMPLGRGAPFAIQPSLTLPDVAALLAALLRGRPVALLPPVPEAEAAALRAALPARVPDEVGALIYTSGSTGRRRCALLDRAAFDASAAAGASVLGWRDDDRWLACLPLAHVGGLSVLTRCLWAGRTAVLADPSPRFEPAAIAAQIARDRVTLASLVPTTLARLLDQTPPWQPPAHLRAVLLGGAAVPASLLARAADRGLTVHTTYGMTETCSHVAIDGRTLPGIELALRDGLIAVRGPVLLRGFAPPDDAEPALDPDGWFVTSDRGAFGDDGRLRVLGRADDVIVTGGEKVDPRAVEIALEAVPGIAAAIVFGAPDPIWGERVVAALFAAPGARPGDDAVSRALASLARHERPHRIAWLDELPLGPTGKIDRAEVVRRVTERER